MLAYDLIGVADKDDLFDLRQLVAQGNGELGGVASNPLVLCRSERQPQRAVDTITGNVRDLPSPSSGLSAYSLANPSFAAFSASCPGSTPYF